MIPTPKTSAIVLEPGEGRTYPMGRMSATFKADLKETDSTLSVSEWWLEPNTEGPARHQHPEAHLFYVLQGSVAFFLTNRGWFDAAPGACIYIPGGTEHGFENTTGERVGFLSINTPGGFEHSLPQIQSFFADNPLGDCTPRTD